MDIPDHQIEKLKEVIDDEEVVDRAIDVVQTDYTIAIDPIEYATIGTGVVHLSEANAATHGIGSHVLGKITEQFLESPTGPEIPAEVTLDGYEWMVVFGTFAATQELSTGRQAILAGQVGGLIEGKLPDSSTEIIVEFGVQVLGLNPEDLDEEYLNDITDTDSVDIDID